MKSGLRWVRKPVQEFVPIRPCRGSRLAPTTSSDPVAASRAERWQPCGVELRSLLTELQESWPLEDASKPWQPICKSYMRCQIFQVASIPSPFPAPLKASTSALQAFGPDHPWLGGWPVHGRMFSCIPGLQPLDAVSTSWIVTNNPIVAFTFTEHMLLYINDTRYWFSCFKLHMNKLFIQKQNTMLLSF